MILKGELLEFRHYAGLPCHLVGCTQALLWPAQGPSQYVGAKVPLRAKPRLLLLSSSLPLSLSFFLFCGFSEETGFLFLSVSPLPPPLLSTPSTLISVNTTLKLCLQGVFVSTVLTCQGTLSRWNQSLQRHCKQGQGVWERFRKRGRGSYNEKYFVYR